MVKKIRKRMRTKGASRLFSIFLPRLKRNINHFLKENHSLDVRIEDVELGRMSEDPTFKQVIAFLKL